MLIMVWMIILMVVVTLLVDGDAFVVLIFVGAVSNHFLLYFPGLDCLQQYTGHISLITHNQKS